MLLPDINCVATNLATHFVIDLPVLPDPLPDTFPGDPLPDTFPNPLPDTSSESVMKHNMNKLMAKLHTTSSDNRTLF